MYSVYVCTLCTMNTTMITIFDKRLVFSLRTFTGAKTFLLIHLPAASKKFLQSFSACLHFSFLQLSHLSDIFFLQSSFALTTASLASLNFFSAASKTALTAFAAASNAYKKKRNKKFSMERYFYLIW